MRERWGRDLLHCPYCHGWEVRDQPLGVLGGTAEAVAHAQLVRQWSADVVLFADGITLQDDQRDQLTARGIVVVADPVARLVIEDDLLHRLGCEDVAASVVTSWGRLGLSCRFEAARVEDQGAGYLGLGRPCGHCG